MATAIDQFKTHLTDLSLRYRELDADTLLLGFRGEQVQFEALIIEHGSVLSVRVPELARVPRGRIDETLRLANLLLARVLRIGAFYVVPETSGLAFEFGLPALDGVSASLVKLTVTALFALDDYFAIFAPVWWGGLTAQQAFAKLSNSPETEEPPEQGLDLAI